MKRLLLIALATAFSLSFGTSSSQDLNPDADLQDAVRGARGGEPPPVRSRNDAEVIWEWADHGIILSKSTVEKVKWLDRAREDLLTRKNDLERVARKLRAEGWNELADDLDGARDQLTRVYRQMPQYENRPGWLREFRRYFERKDAGSLADHSKAIKSVDTILDDLTEKLGEERLKLASERGDETQRERIAARDDLGGASDARKRGAAGAAAKGDGADRAGGAGAGTTASSGFEVKVVRRAGEADFFINGKDAAAGVFFATDPDGNVRVRVLGRFETRKRSLNFKPTPNTVSYTAEPHKWEYTIKSGDFTGRTTWKVKGESYDWSVLSNRDGAFKTLKQNSGVHPAVKNDVMLVKPNGAAEVTLTATGEVVWERDSSRGVFLPDQTETAGGSITISIIPRLR